MPPIPAPAVQTEITESEGEGAQEAQLELRAVSMGYLKSTD